MEVECGSFPRPLPLTMTNRRFGMDWSFMPAILQIIQQNPGKKNWRNVGSWPGNFGMTLSCWIVVSSLTFFLYGKMLESWAMIFVECSAIVWNLRISFLNEDGVFFLFCFLQLFTFRVGPRFSHHMLFHFDLPILRPWLIAWDPRDHVMYKDLLRLPWEMRKF